MKDCDTLRPGGDELGVLETKDLIAHTKAYSSQF